MTDCWSVEDILGNIFIQKTMTRDFKRLSKIFNLLITFRNITFMIIHGNVDLYQLMQHLQDVLLPKWYQSIAILKGTDLCAGIWRINPSNGDSNFGFSVVLSLVMWMSLKRTWARRPKLSLVLVSQLFSPFPRVYRLK